MGLIIPSFKNAIFQDILNSIRAGISYYYAFASNPTVNNYIGIPALTNDDYTDKFNYDWNMIFGKLLTSNNMMPMIQNNIWASNTYYTQYDNTSNTLYSNNNYYTIVSPSIFGGYYNIYKCINNANNSASTVAPTLIQPTTFTTNDGYSWRYITSISSPIYNKFTANNYIPVYPNTTIQSSANQNSGIDNVIVVNGGNGYSTYLSGTIQGGNSSVVQLNSYANTISGFYNNNTIYVTGPGGTSGQLKIISYYVSNSSGNWAILNNSLTGVSIGSLTYSYYISPQIYFNTDGSLDPVAYSVVNTYTNSISNVVILTNGSNISWANVTIVTNTALVTSNASLYAIVPPPGGHGFDPTSELLIQGIGYSFSFANSELSTIPTNISYNKVGIMKNPTAANSSGGSNSSLYSSNTFNQLLNGTVSTTFNIGDQVTGQTSGALGTVAFANATNISLTGDKYFQNNETISSVSTPSTFSTLVITSFNQIYTKNAIPLYISSTSNINRSNTVTEVFSLVIEL